MRGISMSESTTCGTLLGQLLERVEPVLGERDAVALAHQQALRDAAHRERIVDDQDQRRQRRRLRPPDGGAAAGRGRHRQRGASRGASPYSVASATGL